MSSPWPGSLEGRRGERGAVARAVAGLVSLLLEPAGDQLESPPAPVAVPGERPVIAVFGLARGCGTTTVARALAAGLAERDPSGTAAVACELPGSVIPFSTKPAARLARSLERTGSPARAVGRLCLVDGHDTPRLADSMRGLAPLVIDAGADVLGGVLASVADRCVIVTTPSVEPALARVGADCISRVSAEPLVAVNRTMRGPGDDRRDPGDQVVELPDSRMGAQLALGGREARGELGRAIAGLADRCAGQPRES